MLAGIVGIAVLLLPFVRRNGTVPAISGH